MDSANEENAVKTAIDICTMYNFKRDVIKVSGAWISEVKAFKKEWNKTIESYISDFFMINPMRKDTREKVSGIVFSIAFRMLTWTEYHVRTFDLNHDFCLRLLTSNVLTKEGIIKYERTEEELENGRLSVEQRFRLASWHCSKDISEGLFKQLDEKSKKYYTENEDDYIPEIMQFWAYYVMGELPKLMAKKSLSSKAEIIVGRPGNREFIDNPEVLSQSSRPFSEEAKQFASDEDIKEGLKNSLERKLQSAILSGSKTAVECCIDEILEIKKKRKNFLSKEFLSDALIGLVIQRMEFTTDLMGESKTSKIEHRKYVDDWVAFRRPKYSKNEVWLPNHFMVDTFYYVFSIIPSEEKRRIGPKLMNAIEFNLKVRTSHSKQLFCHFLCWPYQDKLMEFVNLCWKYIPFDYYGTFLFTILDRIKPSPDSLYYGENTCFDYQELLLEFWQSSPENFKRYVFEDTTEDKGFQLQDKTWVFNIGKKLLLKMIVQEIFVMNSSIIRDILSHANPSERENFIYSHEGRAACEVLKEKYGDFLDELINQCIGSEEKAEKFKAKLRLVERCLELIRVGNFLEANNEIASLKLTVGEIFDVKEYVLCCVEGRKLLLQLGFESNDNFNSFVMWSNVTAYNKMVRLCSRLLNNEGKLKCLSFSINRPERVDRFLNLCYSLEEITQEKTKEKIRKFKGDLFFSYSISHCRVLMFEDIPNTEAVISMEERLQLVDKFFNWCFNDVEEEEKNNKFSKFKRDLIRHENGDFHYRFIKSSRFSDAILFFTWAGFDLEDIEIEKKDKLFTCGRTTELLENSMSAKDDPDSKDVNEKFINDLLRWCLVDSDAVNLFKTRYSVYLSDLFVINIINDLNRKSGS